MPSDEDDEAEEPGHDEFIVTEEEGRHQKAHKKEEEEEEEEVSEEVHHWHDGGERRMATTGIPSGRLRSDLASLADRYSLWRSKASTNSRRISARDEKGDEESDEEDEDGLPRRPRSVWEKAMCLRMGPRARGLMEAKACVAFNFLHQLGQALVIPTLWQYTQAHVHTSSSSTPTDSAGDGATALFLGELLAVYSVGHVMASPLLAYAGHRIGFKTAMLLCLALGAAGDLVYLGAANAPQAAAVLLLIGRLLAGISSAQQSVGQACVSECLTAIDGRAHYLGSLAVASLVAFVLGPLIGALLDVLVKSSFVVSLGGQQLLVDRLSLPAVVSLLLAVVNLLLLSATLSFTRTAARMRSAFISSSRSRYSFAAASVHQQYLQSPDPDSSHSSESLNSTESLNSIETFHSTGSSTELLNSPTEIMDSSSESLHSGESLNSSQPVTFNSSATFDSSNFASFNSSTYDSSPHPILLSSPLNSNPSPDPLHLHLQQQSDIEELQEGGRGPQSTSGVDVSGWKGLKWMRRGLMAALLCVQLWLCWTVSGFEPILLLFPDNLAGFGMLERHLLFALVPAMGLLGLLGTGLLRRLSSHPKTQPLLLIASMALLAVSSAVAIDPHDLDLARFLVSSALFGFCFPVALLQASSVWAAVLGPRLRPLGDPMRLWLLVSGLARITGPLWSSYFYSLLNNQPLVFYCVSAFGSLCSVVLILLIWNLMADRIHMHNVIHLSHVMPAFELVSPT